MAKTDKIWRDAIMRAVRRLGSDPQPENPTEAQRLDLLADALVAKGLESDVPAIKEIGDRLDGKATQIIAGDEENPLAFAFVGMKDAVAKKLASIAEPGEAPSVPVVTE